MFNALLLCIMSKTAIGVVDLLCMCVVHQTALNWEHDQTALGVGKMLLE